MPVRQRWVVTTSGELPLDQVGRELARAGFSIDPDGLLAEIGCVIGSADPAVVPRLRRIPGVIDVSPPPEAGIP